MSKAKSATIDQNETSNMKYDLIGDIHGYADELKSLLGLLGYVCGEGGYSHPKGRKVIFLGDYIDRGPKIREVLVTVREMVESGSAIALMGNHEFNALGYHTPDGHGGWLRPHTPEKIEQHRATVEQISNPYPEEWRDWMQWFSQLPIYLDLKGLRAVHAAWDDAAIQLLKDFGTITGSVLREMCKKGTPLANAKEILLNGRELKLPEGYSFSDKAGFKRTEIRVRWWMDLRGLTYRDAVFPASTEVPSIPVPEEILSFGGYGNDSPPVFFGHYWLPHGTPFEPQAASVACLDYSVAKMGSLAAYRWDGEPVLCAEKMVQIRSKH